MELVVHLELAGIPPVHATKNSACYDLAIPCAISIKARDRLIIPLGISLKIPEGYCVKIYGRSSTFSTHGLLVPETIIDADYDGTVHGFVWNTRSCRVTLPYGTRLFQMQLVKLEDYSVVCDNQKIDPINAIRVGGLGSTGEGQ